MKYLLILGSFLFHFQAEPHWTFNFDNALHKASKSDKIVLLVFSGSDWCKPCIQLHQQLFETEDFVAFAEERLVLVKADFPYKKKNQLSAEQTALNEKLAAKYNSDGVFPLALFIDAEGKVIGKFGFDKTKSAQDYISEFKTLLP